MATERVVDSTDVFLVPSFLEEHHVSVTIPYFFRPPLSLPTKQNSPKPILHKCYFPGVGYPERLFTAIYWLSFERHAELPPDAAPVRLF